MNLYVSITACSLITLGLALVSFVTIRYKASRFKRLLKRLPGPSSVPIVGNSLELSGSVDDLLEIMCGEWIKQYGGIYKAYIGPKPHIMISSPNIIQMMLTSPRILNKGAAYYFLCPWLGDGLLTSSDEKWLLRRCVLSPAYESQMADMMDIFNQETFILNHQIEKALQAGVTNMDVYPLVSRCALDIICGIAAGQAVNAQTEESDYASAVFSMADIIVERILRPLCWDNEFFTHTSLWERHETALSVLQKFTEKVVGNRRIHGNLLSFRRSFLDGMLEKISGTDNFCDGDVMEELDTFIFTGFQSLSVAIGWFLYSMAANPRSQEQLLDEIGRNFDSGDRACCARNLTDMKYLDNCVKEVLRLYPSLPFFARSISEEVCLGDYTIPAGCDAMVLVYALHHDPQIFSDPDTFCPERFYVQSKSQMIRDPFTFIPFGTGPKDCIAQGIAVTAIKVAVTGLLRRFKFQLDPDRLEDPKPTSRIFFKPLNGIHLTVSRR